MRMLLGYMSRFLFAVLKLILILPCLVDFDGFVFFCVTIVVKWPFQQLLLLVACMFVNHGNKKIILHVLEVITDRVRTHLILHALINGTF